VENKKESTFKILKRLEFVTVSFGGAFFFLPLTVSLQLTSTTDHYVIFDLGTLDLLIIFLIYSNIFMSEVPFICLRKKKKTKI